MNITYNTFESFHAGIAELVKLGLTFKANGETLTIILTGGY